MGTDEISFNHSAELTLGLQHDELVSLNDSKAGSHAQFLLGPQNSSSSLPHKAEAPPPLPASQSRAGMARAMGHSSGSRTSCTTCCYSFYRSTIPRVTSRNRFGQEARIKTSSNQGAVRPSRVLQALRRIWTSAPGRAPGRPRMPPRPKSSPWSAAADGCQTRRSVRVDALGSYAVRLSSESMPLVRMPSGYRPSRCPWFVCRRLPSDCPTGDGAAPR